MTNVLKLKTSELVYKTGEAEKQVMKHLGDTVHKVDKTIF
jgi:hypothetical protein